MIRHFGAALAAMLVIAGLGTAARGATQVIEAESLGHTPYQSVVTACSSSFATCDLSFAAVPHGKRLVVVNVSCGIGIKHPSLIAFIALEAAQEASPIKHYLPVPPAYLISGGNYDFYSLDVQTSAVFAAGQKPSISIFTGNETGDFVGTTCTVTGYLVAA